MLKFFVLINLAILFMMNSPAHGQDLIGGGEANAELKTNPESLNAWRDLRYGMFIHWGPISLKGTEIGWSRGGDVPAEEYDQLYKRFNPENFDASQWVSLIREAGMKYLVIVSKHHDGFVMWDSETTDYDIMSTPFGRDILKELSRECKKQGILFGTYYSICDWRHPDYPVEHNRDEWKKDADMDRYIRYMKTQLKELVKKYHTKILWFDGEWEDPWTHEMGMDLYQYVRSLDDEILINNRVDKGRSGMEGISLSSRYAGDFATPEQQVGRFDTKTPWESCITLCTQWAWKPDDILKTREECIQTLVRTAGGDGNLLLNVGPKPDGTIEERQAERLKEIGEWLKKYGETIYGTRGGPLPPEKWGVSTWDGNKIYLHVLEEETSIRLRDFPHEILSVRLFSEPAKPDYRLEKQDLIINIPVNPEPWIDRVIELRVKQ
ncbi:MAG: alpha-L-fucosidase [Cyclobacteriaceae bacterium]|nr:alpha-L-fucosidase [Cyclobacteriaceae bacterium]